MSDALTIGPALPASSFFDSQKQRVRTEHHIKFEVKFRDEGSPARLAHIQRELRKLGISGVEVRVVGGVSDRIRAVQLNPSKSCPPPQNLKSEAIWPDFVEEARFPLVPEAEQEPRELVVKRELYPWQREVIENLTDIGNVGIRVTGMPAELGMGYMGENPKNLAPSEESQNTSERGVVADKEV